MANDGEAPDTTSTHAIRVNKLLTISNYVQIMLISHSYRFALFPEPMGACPWIDLALDPWLDQPVATTKNAVAGSYFFRDMSPSEAELAFDMAGFAFRSYTRIAIVQNPYAKMAQLYDRIAATDRVWRTRRMLGFKNPEFTRWLRSTQPNGNGAAFHTGPRWRRFGAWSAAEWCGDRITHVVRAETAEQDLPEIFRGIGIAPAFGGRAIDALKLGQSVTSRYDDEARTLIRERYEWDLQLYSRLSADLLQVA